MRERLRKTMNPYERLLNGVPVEQEEPKEEPKAEKKESKAKEPKKAEPKKKGSK